jgi:hypothetical protein
MLQQLRKIPRNSKIQENSTNQGDHDDTKRQSNHSKNTKFNGEDQMSGKREKTRSGKGNTNHISSPVESPISVVGKSPCGQVDLLLRARPLTLRHKVLHIDTEFLLDLIKMMNKREERRYVPYERRFSLQGPG